MRQHKAARLIGIVLIGWPVLLCAQSGNGKTFGTPEEARDALLQAAAISARAIRDLLGPESDQISGTGDPVQDKTILENFNARAKKKAKLEVDEWNPKRVTLLVGEEEWPFAIPLVQDGGGWRWDVQAGAIEIRNRIVGANELDAIEICEGYVEAQEQYASVDRDGSGIPQYARKVSSSPGKKDGLYWPEDPDSPIGGLIARAIAEGYRAPSGEQRQPYHGYFYKILTAQGPAAVGGARDYIVQGLMLGGFALVAWPAEYGASGYKTFIVNQDGVVYEQDLGPDTAAEAEAMTEFNPDETWDLAPLVSWEPLDE
jgi:hypothetical protein